MSRENQENYRLLPVCNSKMDKLFVANVYHRQLYILKVNHDPEIEIKPFSDMLREDIIMTQGNFDYKPGRKYYRINESLLYVDNGNLVEINLLKGTQTNYCL